MVQEEKGVKGHDHVGFVDLGKEPELNSKCSGHQSEGLGWW